MGNKQRHRGQHAADPRLFQAQALPRLNEAVADLSWLMTQRYPLKASLKLVGDRYRLTDRQRKAVMRAACTDEAQTMRPGKELSVDQLKGQALAIDGYNLLITIESGLAGGVVIECRDGAYRDIASIHGTYRKVEETMPALTMIGVMLQKLEVPQVCWYLDRPISNSGRLKGIMYELAEGYHFPWQIELVNNPDKMLCRLPELVAVSSDGWVLDRVGKWVNLNRHIIDRIPTANVIRLSGIAS